MNSKELLNLGGIVTGVAATAVSTLYCPAVIATIIGGISINLASDVAGKFGPKRLKRLIKNPHPDELNHDFQKAFQYANIMAVDNIKLLYNETVKDKTLKRNADKFCTDLKENIKINLEPKKSVSEEEIDTYLYEKSEDASNALLEKLNVSTAEYNLDDTFTEIFHKNYIAQAQLCFGEILKEPENPENERAWRAWQKWMGEEIRSDLKNVNAKIDGLTEKQRKIQLPELDEDQLKKLKQLSNDLKHPLVLEDKFKAALDNSLNEINLKVDILINESHEILRLNTATYNTVGQFDKKLDTHWFSRKTMWLWSAIAVTIIITGTIWAYYSSQPFSTSFKVYGLNKEDYLPLQNRGVVELTLGEEIKTAQINQNGVADFKQIPAKFKKKPVKVTIAQTGGEIYHIQPIDTLVLNPNSLNELPVIQEGLDRLFGSVKDYRTGDYLEGVIVQSLGIIDTTNQMGEFNLQIPPEKQTRFTEIKFFKEGYQPRDEINVPVQTGEPMKVLLKQKALADEL